MAVGGVESTPLAPIPNQLNDESNSAHTEPSAQLDAKPQSNKPRGHASKRKAQPFRIRQTESKVSSHSESYTDATLQQNDSSEIKPTDNELSFQCIIKGEDRLDEFKDTPIIEGTPPSVMSPPLTSIVPPKMTPSPGLATRARKKLFNKPSVREEADVKMSTLLGQSSQSMVPVVSLERLDISTVNTATKDDQTTAHVSSKNNKEDQSMGNAVNTYDIQKTVLTVDGPVVALKALSIRLAIDMQPIRAALEHMISPGQDNNYIGEIITIGGQQEIFFKCPLQMITQNALAPYHVDIDTYKSSFVKVPMDSMCLLTPWYDHVESMVANCPYRMTMLPLHAMGLTDDDFAKANRIRTRIMDLKGAKADL